MRLPWWAPAVLVLMLATPVAAQEPPPEGPPPTAEPGLVIVGHGPDVPNVPSATESPTADPGAYVPMLVVVPVPIAVPAGHPNHRRGAAPFVTVPVERPHPIRQFLNDPSRQFINPPGSPRVPNP